MVECAQLAAIHDEIMTMAWVCCDAVHSTGGEAITAPIEPFEGRARYYLSFERGPRSEEVQGGSS
jgi:hypothetical protein